MVVGLWAAAVAVRCVHGFAVRIDAVGSDTAVGILGLSLVDSQLVVLVVDYRD